MNSLWKPQNKEVIQRLKELTKRTDRLAYDYEQEHLKETGEPIESGCLFAFKLGCMEAGIENILALLEDEF